MPLRAGGTLGDGSKDERPAGVSPAAADAAADTQELSASGGVSPPAAGGDPDAGRERADSEPARERAATEPARERAVTETPRERAAWEPLFSAGELVGGRYRVVRFLAGGGAGEVYEVEDAELGGRVALKALRHPVSRDPRRFERFRREIHLARRVTHPNVCRLYDAGHHGRRDGAPRADTERVPEPEEIFFLTMELLAGESLATRLAADGRLAPAAALPILRQIAAGLDAAHAAGVIHRDLKCANVMLVRAPAAPGGVRAVVTDFGLARAGGEDAASGVTLTGTILGTPSYMAPEQVEGGEITAAADIYAFGVMLFEMVTGELPFEGDSPLSVAVARLKHEPPSPRALWPALDGRWDRVIRWCMARRPADRPPTASAAVAALADESTDLLPRPRARRALLAAGAAAAVLLGAVALWRWRGRDQAPPPSAPAPVAAPLRPRPAVAVLGFKNLSGRKQDAWLSTAFVEMLSSELAAGERVRTVPGETVARVKSELTLPDANSLAADTLDRLRRSLGNDYVLLGSYVVPPGSDGVRLELHLQNTHTADDAPSAFEGTQRELFALVARAGEALRAKVGAGTGAGATAVQPASADAARWYAEGLAALRLYDAVAARASLEQAVAADPGFPFAWVALAETWKRLGYDGRAVEASQRAIELSRSLPREQRLLVEGRARLDAKDPGGAAAIYRELAATFPDDPDHPLHLAEALVEGGDARAAVALLEARATLPGDPDPRASLALARAFQRLGDSTRMLDAARRGGELGRNAHADLLVARARHYEGMAQQSLGQPAAARAAFEAALATYEQAGDRYSAAQEQRALAAFLRAQGDLRGALQLAERALGTCRAIGARAEEARALNTIANVYYQQGELKEAARRYETTLAVFREIGDRHSEAALLGNLANVRAVLGDLDAAVAAHDRALAIKREEGSKNGIATSLVGLGAAELARGDLAAASGHLEEALALARETGERSLLASTLYVAGDVRFERGDLDGARQHHLEALRIRDALGEKGAIAESHTAVARVDVEAGTPAALRDAASILVDAARELQAEGSADSEADARIVLARCLRLAGDVAGARAELARAAELAARSEDRSLALAADVERGRLDGATGQRPAALERLRAAAREAERRHRRGLALEARLALAELGTAAARRAVAVEAQTHGYGRIAARAAAAPPR